MIYRCSSSASNLMMPTCACKSLSFSRDVIIIHHLFVSQSQDCLQVYGGHSNMVTCMAVHNNVVRGKTLAKQVLIHEICK